MYLGVVSVFYCADCRMISKRRGAEAALAMGADPNSPRIEGPGGPRTCGSWHYLPPKCSYKLRVKYQLMSGSKFYHYKVWFEDSEDGEKVDLHSNLSLDVRSDTPDLISEDGQKQYYVQLQDIQTHWFHGLLFRGKDEDSYMRLDDQDNFERLSDETPGEGEAGERNSDLVEFGMIRRSNNLHILLEVGFQTPGIGKLSGYLNQELSYDGDYKLKRETKMGPDAEEKIEELIGTDLKTINLSFKKNPTTYDEIEDVDAGVDTLSGDNYRVEFGLSLQRGSEDSQTTDEALTDIFTNMFNRDNQPITNSVRQLDLPKMMYSFDVKALDGNRTVEKNLADTTHKEEIDKTLYGFFDEQLGERLCEEIQEEL